MALTKFGAKVHFFKVTVVLEGEYLENGAF